MTITKNLLFGSVHIYLFIYLLASNAVAGESALDRIACGLGGKIILPMIKQHIMQMLHNRESRSCFLKCVAVSSFNESCVCWQLTGSTAMLG